MLLPTGNPSSVHQAGRAARHLLEDAREAIAARFGATPQTLVFTSGGSEADMTAIHAMARHRRIITSAIEHDAIRSAAPEAVILPVDPRCIVELDALEHLLRDGTASIVCLMLANNETGVIQPVQEAAALCRPNCSFSTAC